MLTALLRIHSRSFVNYCHSKRNTRCSQCVETRDRAVATTERRTITTSQTRRSREIQVPCVSCTRSQHHRPLSSMEWCALHALHALLVLVFLSLCAVKEFVRVLLHGQSFLIYQVDRMALCTVVLNTAVVDSQDGGPRCRRDAWCRVPWLHRNRCSKLESRNSCNSCNSCTAVLKSHQRLAIPVAPALGLLLDRFSLADATVGA